jgi:hypothetical protein
LRLFEAAGEADLPPFVDLNRVLRRGEKTSLDDVRFWPIAAAASRRPRVGYRFYSRRACMA